MVESVSSGFNIFQIASIIVVWATNNVDSLYHQKLHEKALQAPRLNSLTSNLNSFTIRSGLAQFPLCSGVLGSRHHLHRLSDFLNVLDRLEPDGNGLQCGHASGLAQATIANNLSQRWCTYYSPYYSIIQNLHIKTL